MPEHIQYNDRELFNPETHHEHSDVPVRPLFWSIVIFIVFGVVSHFALFFLYKTFARAEERRMDPPATQVARPASADVPQNQPLLQPFARPDVSPNRNTPVTDLQDMRKAEDRVLHQYGWVDQQRGVVHIPIDEAKKRFAAQAAVATQSAVPPAPDAAAAAERPASPPPGGTQ